MAEPPTPPSNPGQQPPAPGPAPAIADSVRSIPHGKRVSLWIRFIIVFAAASAVTMVMLIFYRSMSVTEPTAVIVVNGDSQWDGSAIVVSSDSERVAAAVLNRDNLWRTPILLQPGDYRLNVSLGGRSMMAQSFVVGYMRVRSFELPTALTIVGNPSMTGAEVRLSGDRHPFDVSVLSSENQFSAVMYRYGGSYHFDVVQHSKSIREGRVDIVDHRPAVIRLDASPAASGSIQ